MGLGCSGSLEPTAYRVPISILVCFGSKSSEATEGFRHVLDSNLQKKQKDSDSDMISG
jgi:hypothetical protein